MISGKLISCVSFDLKNLNVGKKIKASFGHEMISTTIVMKKTNTYAL